MALAVLSGLGSGALHAVTGPDHVLSLTPLALSARKTAFRLGVLWGLGHALGTALLIVALTFVATYVELDAVSSLSARIAGAALLGMGLWSFWSLYPRRAKSAGAPAQKAERRQRGVLTIGLVHGLTGAAALLLLLPAVFSSGDLLRWSYLGGFALGSTLAMGALTWVVARAASRTLKSSWLGRIQRLAALGSIAFGAGYLAFA